MHYLEKRSIIESSKAFQRLSEKTQVFFPESGRGQIVKNRLSHSYEVATSALFIAEKLKEKYNIEIDYNYSIFNVSLLHDIGHPPFGHSGAGLIDTIIQKKGLEEGFDDNNNNLIVINKNSIHLDDYDLASLVKYPNKLYASQKEYYELKIQKSIKQDITHFSKIFNSIDTPQRTIACEIMDEADRNSYTTSDLSDFFMFPEIFSEFGSFDYFFTSLFDKKYSVFINNFIEQIYQSYKKNDKAQIKYLFNKIKNMFNENYYIQNNLSLGYQNEDLYQFREHLSKLEFNCFIRTPFFKDSRKQNLNELKFFIDYIFENNYYTSNTYKKTIETAQSENEKLKAFRDMIGEVSDWFVINTVNHIKGES